MDFHFFSTGRRCRQSTFGQFCAWHLAFLVKTQPKIVKRPDSFDFSAWTVHVDHALMHEVTIMAEALRLAVVAAQSNGAARIVKLRLRIGAMSSVVPEALRFAFDVVCRGTLAEGAVLEIEQVPAACWCASCRAEFECADLFGECPRCHEVSGELRRGRELEIASVEVIPDEVLQPRKTRYDTKDPKANGSVTPWALKRE
jgi:hydrogenase nickel incorporation protein HypA/HybF